MNLNLFRKSVEKIVAVADIGGGSVSFAVIAVKKGKPARVLAANRATLPPEERKESAIIAGTGEMILESGKKVLDLYARGQKDTRAIEELYVIIHAPWTHAKSVAARAKFEKDTRITGRSISHLAQEALARPANGGASETGFDRKNFLEASVTQIELNGYPTNEPEGKWAREISIMGLVSDCDPELRNAVAAGLGQLLPHVRPIYRSSTRALLSVLRGYISEREYVVADVMNACTSITVISEGVVGEQFLVPEGVHTILKRLSEKGMPEETLSLIRMLERDHCESEACDALKASIGRVEPELVRAFGETMGKIAASRRLPNHLVLVTHADMSQWLSRFFSRIDFTQFTQTAQPFVVRELTTKDVEAFVVPENGVIIDTGLAVACVLVDKEAED